jgi:hypothetical protein
MKPIAWYVYAQSMRGPIAEMLDEVKAGTTLENMRHGRDTVIEIWEAPRAAAGGNRSFFARR